MPSEILLRNLFIPNLKFFNDPENFKLGTNSLMYRTIFAQGLFILKKLIQSSLDFQIFGLESRTLLRDLRDQTC